MVYSDTTRDVTLESLTLLSQTELDCLRVVLVEPRNPLNIGAAARAMSNFGFRQLRVVMPYEKAFREARSAVGAADILTEAQEFGSVAEAVADCTLVIGATAARRRELRHPVLRVEQAAPLLREHILQRPAALLFGTEKYGLSRDDLSFCHSLMTIETPGTNPSLNLGQAVAVCLHEMVREASDRAGTGVPKETAEEAKEIEPEDKLEPASSGEVERVTEVLFDVLRDTRYWNPGSGATTEQKVRRLVRRLNLSAEDAEVVLGMLRQILWKIRLGGKKVVGDRPPGNV